MVLLSLCIDLIKPVRREQRFVSNLHFFSPHLASLLKALAQPRQILDHSALFEDGALAPKEYVEVFLVLQVGLENIPIVQ